MRESDIQCARRPEICAELDRPGRGLDDISQVDWSKVESSLDQTRIKDVLAEMDLQGKQLLHVGVGNSQLAAALASRTNGMDGLTMHANEKAHADSLGIPNYRVFLINKYSKQFGRLDTSYDFIIDNNLGSYACCKYHFYRMLDNYCDKLVRGGRIVTDQRGMDWTYDCQPAWRMTYEELARLSEIFPLKAAKLTNMVYALARQ